MANPKRVHHPAPVRAPQLPPLTYIPPYLGIDRMNAPYFDPKNQVVWHRQDRSRSLQYMEWLIHHSNLNWVGVYLVPGNRGWNNLVVPLQSQGWGVLPTFIKGDGITSYDQGANQGRIDALQLKQVARQAGLEPGSVIYLDSELTNDGKVSEQTLNYLRSWATTLADPRQSPIYRAGFYSQPNICGYIAYYIPDVYLWPIRLSTRVTTVFSPPFEVQGDRLTINPARLPNVETLSGSQEPTKPVDVSSLRRWRSSPPSKQEKTAAESDRVFPLAIQFWYFAPQKNHPAIMPSRGTQMPQGLTPVETWDYSASFVRDPSMPVAEPRTNALFVRGQLFLIFVSQQQGSSVSGKGEIWMVARRGAKDTGTRSSYPIHPSGRVASVSVQTTASGVQQTVGYLACASSRNPTSQLLIRRLNTSTAPGVLAALKVEDYRMIGRGGHALRQPHTFSLIAPDPERESPLALYIEENNQLAWCSVALQDRSSTLPGVMIHISSGLAVVTLHPQRVITCFFDHTGALKSVQLQQSNSSTDTWTAATPVPVTQPNSPDPLIPCSLVSLSVGISSVLLFGISKSLRLVVAEYNGTSWGAFRSVGEVADLLHPTTELTAIVLSPDRIQVMGIDTVGRIKLFDLGRVQGRWNFGNPSRTIRISEASNANQEVVINPFSDLQAIVDESGRVYLACASMQQRAILFDVASGNITLTMS